MEYYCRYYKFSSIARKKNICIYFSYMSVQWCLSLNTLLCVIIRVIINHTLVQGLTLYSFIVRLVHIVFVYIPRVVIRLTTQIFVQYTSKDMNLFLSNVGKGKYQYVEKIKSIQYEYCCLLVYMWIFYFPRAIIRLQRMTSQRSIIAINYLLRINYLNDRKYITNLKY